MVGDDDPRQAARPNRWPAAGTVLERGAAAPPTGHVTEPRAGARGLFGSAEERPLP